MKKDRERIVKKLFEEERGKKLKAAIIDQLNAVKQLKLFPDKEIELLLIEEEKRALEALFQKKERDDSIKFNPSGATKCARELFYKNCRVKEDDLPMEPYQVRWVENSSAVHRRVQKDLLYSEKYLDRPSFKVAKTKDGFPAWEDNIYKEIEVSYKKIPFKIAGKMDGILRFRDGTKIGFEFKTKSTTVAAIGDYKLRNPQPEHVAQTVAYSMLFGINEFLIVYESVAKDDWRKGAHARPDLRAHYVRVKHEDKLNLWRRWGRIAEFIQDGEIPPPEYDKCLFCPFKSRCRESEMLNL